MVRRIRTKCNGSLGSHRTSYAVSVVDNNGRAAMLGDCNHNEAFR